MIEPAIKRVIGFVDGQNVFYAAKKAFGYSYPKWRGVTTTEKAALTLAGGGANVTQPGQYTRSSVTTLARRKPIERRASSNRRSAAASTAVRTGMNGVAMVSRSVPEATTWRVPAVSRRATVQPSNDPTLSRARPASLSGLSLEAYSFEMRFPRSSSSQYATVFEKMGPDTPGAAVASLTWVRSFVFVGMSFALRGAPCGDDAHITVRIGRGDDQEQVSG